MVKGTLVPKTGKLFGRVATVVPDVLYFASFQLPPSADPEIRYVSVDERVHYEPFYSDFGPLNLSVLYRFCKYLHGLLEAKSKRKVCCWTSANEENRANGAYLLASYIMIFHNVSADEAYLRIQNAQDNDTEFVGFRDAAMGDPTYLLHVHDVLRGMEKAIEHGWLDFGSFDPDEYEFYERVENGDFNWIIPGKILSFCGPHAKSIIENGYPYHAPEVYFDYFRARNVTTIVRLNMKMYEAGRFTDAGFEHVDLFFIDGSTPSDEIVERFIEVVDKAPGGVAIHCKAGLGRTGTLIACWMMKEFGLSAAECMGWLRVCRPGSVIGPQQQFLVRKQKFCWNMANNNLVVQIPTVRAGKRKDSERSEGKVSRLTNKVDGIRIGSAQQQNGNCVGERVANRSKPTVQTVCGTVDETALDSVGRSQGDRLLAMKVRSQHAAYDHVEERHNKISSIAASVTRKPAGISNHHGPMHNAIQHGSHSGTLGGATRGTDLLHRTIKSSSQLPNGHLSATNPHLTRLQTSSPRFSSPTTPIKPISASPSSAPHPRFVARNILTTPTSSHARAAQVPISKVTVMSGSLAVSGSSRSTSSLKRITSGSGVRARPYPSNGVRLELPATSGVYELRSRHSSRSPPRLHYPTGTAAAATLPPNAEALIGRTRALKKKYATHGISALSRNYGVKP